jgi:hypothetical protein
VFDGRADLLEGHACVQEPLDDFENQDVPEAIEPLRSGTGGSPHGGFNKACACPVVQLAVGNPRRLARGGATVAGIFIQDRKVLGEKQTLGTACGYSNACRGLL